jgi:hypothetical protein
MDVYDFMLFFAGCMRYLLTMPRKTRIDASGALHHVIARRMECRKDFRSYYDRKKFLNRFELIERNA